MARLTPWEYGQIKTHMHHGLGGAEISRILLKPDGRNHWSETAIQVAVNIIQEDPDFRGEREEGSGAPRKTTKKQDRDFFSSW